MTIEKPGIRLVSSDVIKEMADSCRGVMPYIQQNFELTGNMNISEAQKRGPAVEIVISGENQRLTVVTLPPKSSYKIGEVNFDAEIFPYSPGADKPAVIIDVRRLGIDREIQSLRQLGEGLTFQPGESYSVRTRDRAATVIIRRVFNK